jgi:hypothetical protein
MEPREPREPQEPQDSTGTLVEDCRNYVRITREIAKLKAVLKEKAMELKERQERLLNILERNKQVEVIIEGDKLIRKIDKTTKKPPMKRIFEIVSEVIKNPALYEKINQELEKNTQVVEKTSLKLSSEKNRPAKPVKEKKLSVIDA